LTLERLQRHFGIPSLDVSAAASLADKDVPFEGAHLTNRSIGANHVDEAIV
jgi:hypothetical protein